MGQGHSVVPTKMCGSSVADTVEFNVRQRTPTHAARLKINQTCCMKHYTRSVNVEKNHDFATAQLNISHS